MTISELLQASLLTSSAGDSPVRIYRLREGGRDSAVNAVGFGGNSPVLLAKLDPHGSLWKTSQLCFTGELETFSQTWPISGMTRNGIAYQLPPLVRDIEESGSGSFPTPTQSMGKRGWGLSRSGRARASASTSQNAFRYGYKPPILLLEWLMGYPPGYTSIGQKASETPSSRRSSRK